MSLLCPTRPEHLTDAQGRPYFLWDADVTLDRFVEMLKTGDRETRAYLTGKMMRQAKPDDVFTFTTLSEITDLWPDLERYLGNSREFWRWILPRWGCELRG